MLLNVSNHPSSLWSSEQLAAAKEYGDIRDYPFPNVPPYWDEQHVEKLAEWMLSDILMLNPEAVLCQGEMTLTYLLVKRLTAAGIRVLCACTERSTQENPLSDGTMQKTTRFSFVRFREYR